MISLNDIANILDSNDFFTILTHQYPDGDTLGSSFALCRALQLKGKHARVLCSDKIPTKFDYIKNVVTPEQFNNQFIISVDVADTELLGNGLSHYKDKVDLCIDHHGSNTKYAKQYLIDSSAAATTEIIFLLLEKMSVDFDKQLANCIYTGLSTDTGCFKYSNVTPRTHRIAAVMLESGAEAGFINKLMFDTKSKNRMALEKLVMDTLEFFSDDKCAVVYVTKDMQVKANIGDEDIDGISSIPRRIEGVEVGITLREKDDNTFKISLRTSDRISASSICSKFGGGGHLAAAGCSIQGSLNDAKMAIVKAACEEIEKLS